MARKHDTDSSTDPLPGGGNGGRPPRPPGLPEVSIVVHSRDSVDAGRLPSGQGLVVGRREPSDLRIPDRTLSRQHARFSLVDGRVFVEDLGSRNGTWVDGTRIEQRTHIEIGGEAMLGTAVARVIALSAAGGPALEGDDGFRKHLEEEAARAKLFHRGFAVLAVRAPGPEAASGPFGAWVMQFRAKLRTVDRVNLYTPDTALVLLPETQSEDALKLAQDIASAGGDGGAPHLVGVAVYPESASTAGELLDLAREAADRATAAQRVVSAPTAAWAASAVAGGGEQMIAGKAMRELLETAKRVASARVHVLLQGETGTGKELLARFLYENSPRSGRPFVRVNCGAIPPSLLESMLFGHEKGAFTGALRQQPGVFEAANEGILFLDEIGELTPAAQAALLRVLETGSFSRVGSTDEVKVDVRVIAATHRDLEAMAEEGDFRDDLYYRLNTVVLELPPLRDRRDDIEPLCKHFLEAANKGNGRSVRGIVKDAMALLQAYGWPGNVRELRGAVERAVVLARGEWILPEDLPARVRAAEEEKKGASAAPTGDVKAHLQQVEAQVTQKTLDEVDWNQPEAAKRLGISTRTLRRRIKELGLKPPKKR